MRRWLSLLWVVPIIGFGVAIFSLSPFELAQEWLTDEGRYVFSWWLLTTMAGWAVLPLLFRLLSGLADRGYAMARAAGLLLVGAVFWLLASIGLLQNDPGAIAFAWFLVLVGSLWVWIRWPERPSFKELRQWLIEQSPLIIVTELLFAVTFVAWAYMQAHNPELTSTEKPMEMAFINGIRNSLTFPPKDPWLSGYAISYYYFGYVLAAGLADLSNVTTGMAFNLIDALLFALTMTTAFGVGYNLVCSVGPLQRWRTGGVEVGLGVGLLAATFLALGGHLGTLLVELPFRGYASNIPIVNQIVSDDYFNFWDVHGRAGPFYTDGGRNADGTRNLDIWQSDEVVRLNPNSPLMENYQALPDPDNDGIPSWDDNPQDLGWDYWWWFAHSRLVRDRDLSGNHFEPKPIAEIPQFSFILSDNHPHVLGLPFTVLVIGLAVALVLRPAPLQYWEMVVYGIFIGGMIFANAWDAVYLVVVVAAEGVRRLSRNGTGSLTGWAEFVDTLTLQRRSDLNRWLIGPVYIVVLFFLSQRGIDLSLTNNLPAGLDTVPLVRFVLQMVLAVFLSVPVMLVVNWLLDDTDWSHIGRFGAILFLTFYGFYFLWIESFASQANGFFPNIIHPTRTQQAFLQFGAFILLIMPFVLMQAWRVRHRLNWTGVISIVLIGLFMLFLVPTLSTLFINWQCPAMGEKPGQVEGFSEWACTARSSLLGGVIDDESSAAMARRVIVRRMTAIGSEAVLLLLAGLVAMRLFTRGGRQQESSVGFSPNTGAALLLIGAGVLAALMPDFMYLRDNFSSRINTVFKLYYQAWSLLSISAAYAVYAVLRGPERLRSEAVPTSSPRWRVGYTSYGLLAGVIVFSVLLYPYFAIPSRFLYEMSRPQARACEGDLCREEDPITLDGSSTFVWAGRSWRISDDEFKAMQCLADLEPYQSDAVLVETSGGAYTPELGRFSMYTGIPTLLGWDNHERQWRGAAYNEVMKADTRAADIDLFYRLPADQWNEAKQLMAPYAVDYVVVGIAEVQRYGGNEGLNAPGLSKFAQLLDPVCRYGDVAVYRIQPE